MIQYTINNSPIGKLLVAQSNKGLTHIIFEYQIPQFKFIINKFKDKLLIEGIDLEEIYQQAKENPEVGVILDVEQEDQHVVISIE